MPYFICFFNILYVFLNFNICQQSKMSLELTQINQILDIFSIESLEDKTIEELRILCTTLILQNKILVSQVGQLCQNLYNLDRQSIADITELKEEIILLRTNNIKLEEMVITMKNDYNIMKHEMETKITAVDAKLQDFIEFYTLYVNPKK